MCACVRAGCGDSIVELKKNGTPQRKMALPDDLQSSSFSSFIVIPEVILQSSANASAKQVSGHLVV